MNITFIVNKSLNDFVLILVHITDELVAFNQIMEEEKEVFKAINSLKLSFEPLEIVTIMRTMTWNLISSSVNFEKARKKINKHKQ